MTNHCDIRSKYKTIYQNFKLKLISQKQLDPTNIDKTILDKEFLSLHPKYLEFQKVYEHITTTYRILKEQISNLNNTKENICLYIVKINNYFKK